MYFRVHKAALLSALQARSHVVKGGAVRKWRVHMVREAPGNFDHAHFRYNDTSIFGIFKLLLIVNKAIIRSNAGYPVSVV